jgi:hypothetical protein
MEREADAVKKLMRRRRREWGGGLRLPEPQVQHAARVRRVAPRRPAHPETLARLAIREYVPVHQRWENLRDCVREVRQGWGWGGV